ncbi:hypothetical protein DSM104443_03271 [Usitatibacter rugosus]|uniref:Uncharacterized protein n=1 Tax=Usitatibacter rugosus TaxID=2732067 RepID=A0A6M4GY59_9PROT|nr:hypothetical protein [Usitatibacter rugosus]QJR12186.1 hypothetical protein DSM104443_03271 [Usitatibacter rugosus]
MRLHSTAAACAALLAAAPVAAVQLNPDGLGQALIYPYYTARSSAPGESFQTLVTVVNHTADAKSVRVRFREGANGASVAEFNLYLGPRDMWTAAVIPAGTSDTAQLLTRDTSCVDPPIPVAGLTFAAGSLEGSIEVIEMATLTGAAVAAVTPAGTQGVPPNCALVSAPLVPTVAAPSGGLSGTLTLLHVANGYDFTLNAEALAALSTQPFHRLPNDPYPGFSAAEITPVSVVATNGYLYRSLWPNGREAVSAVLIRSTAVAEYTVDPATQSRSDFVVTFPTRPYYPATSAGTPPFWITSSPPFGNYVGAGTRRRNGVSTQTGLGCFRDDFIGGTHCAPVFWARATTVLTGTTLNPHALSGTPGVFLSATPAASIPEVAPSGWATLIRLSVDTVTSLPGSTRLDLATGEVVTGAHTMRGMPQVGFSARTFRNGSLSCTSGTCQGNYGGVFPFRFLRDITGP